MRTLWHHFFGHMPTVAATVEGAREAFYWCTCGRVVTWYGKAIEAEPTGRGTMRIKA